MLLPRELLAAAACIEGSGHMVERERPDDGTTTAAPSRARTVIGAVLALTGLALAIATRASLVSSPAGLPQEGLIVLGVTIAMASLWVSDAMPLAGTALLPIALFPLLGVASAKDVSANYLSSVVVLLMGGFFLARALERWDVPLVLAHAVEKWAGGSARRLFYGLIGITTLLSMWLSNTATTLIMMTVATAAIARARSRTENTPADVRRFTVALTLGIAYGANVGGMATPVGTAPNAILVGLYNARDHVARDGDAPISFLMFMLAVIPVVVIATPLLAFLLERWLSAFPRDLTLASAIGHDRARLSRGGRRALIVFAFVALLWVFRVDIDLSIVRVPGWASALGLAKFVDDGAVAIIGVLLMMAVPSGEAVRSGAREGASVERLLTWKVAENIPWALVLLFGGGLALADGFERTGLSVWLGEGLVFLQGAPQVVSVFVLTLGVSFLTEVTSNTATTTLLLPVVAAAADTLGLNALALMLPATLAASAAFMMPISTPPNAIAAGVGQVSVPEMVRVGFVLNLLVVSLITIMAIVWLPVVVRMTT
jgi:sodium-dependent dicarboxylate transporter 2/3/5